MSPLMLTQLERAALTEIGVRQTDGREALEAQLATARVTRRENSGAGFFTYLEVDRTTPKFTGTERVLGDIAAGIEGFEQPILLLLFMKDGYAHMLEGATIGDSTVGIDLSTLNFKIWPA